MRRRHRNPSRWRRPMITGHRPQNRLAIPNPTQMRQRDMTSSINEDRARVAGVVGRTADIATCKHQRSA
jgi:hypothetical protein